MNKIRKNVSWFSINNFDLIGGVHVIKRQGTKPTYMYEIILYLSIVLTLLNIWIDDAKTNNIPGFKISWELFTPYLYLI